MLIFIFLIINVVINVGVVRYMATHRLLYTYDEFLYLAALVPVFGSTLIFMELIKRLKHNKDPDVIAYRKYLDKFYENKNKKQ